MEIKTNLRLRAQAEIERRKRRVPDETSRQIWELLYEGECPRDFQLTWRDLILGTADAEGDETDGI